MPNLASLALACTERGMVPDRLVRDRHPPPACGPPRENSCRRRRSCGRTRPSSSWQRCVNHPWRCCPKRPTSSTMSCRPRFSARCSARGASTAPPGGPGSKHLAAAEEAALQCTVRNALLADGQRILELGCGWGSLTLWMAEKLPAQPHHGRVEFAVAARIHHRPRRCGAGSPTSKSSPPTSTSSSPAARFDRVVSVEMFEHLRNWPEVFRRVAQLARARWSLLHARIRPSQHALCIRGARFLGLDVAPFLLGRHDAQHRSRAALPGRPGPARPLALGRYALRAHRRGLARQHGAPAATPCGRC